MSDPRAFPRYEIDELVQWLTNYLAVTDEGKPVTPEDGEPWLRALPRSLHGSFCWAHTAEKIS